MTKVPEQTGNSVPVSDADALRVAIDEAFADVIRELEALADQPPEIAIPQLEAGLTITRRCLAVS